MVMSMMERRRWWWTEIGRFEVEEEVTVLYGLRISG